MTEDKKDYKPVITEAWKCIDRIVGLKSSVKKTEKNLYRNIHYIVSECKMYSNKERSENLLLTIREKAFEAQQNANEVLKEIDKLLGKQTNENTATEEAAKKRN